jgi:GrpB-like predicted nucleotidyltransferase (UPF0157 family)
VTEQIPVRRAAITEYQAAWPDRAAELISTLRAALGPLALAIEHIGSTSIPGLDAKDLLDLQVSTADLESAEAAFGGPLRELGFELSPHRRDHVPAGRDDSPDLWTKRLWCRRSQPGRSGDGVNLHVRAAGSANERFALLFRDWFRAHPGAVPAYAGFKRSLAELAGDLDRYTVTKDWVVDVVIAAAEPWAAATGWTPHGRL